MAFKSFDETEKTASERGLSNLGLINNPFQNALISSYQAANLASQAPNPFMAALGGAAVGAQQLQQNQLMQAEMQPFKSSYPSVYNSLPDDIKEMVGGLPAKDAYALMKTALIEKQQQKGRMELQKSKPQDIFDESDFPVISFTLKSKGYTDEEIPSLLPAFKGQPLSALKAIPSKVRPARSLKNWKVIKNDLGIPTRVEGVDEVTNSPFSQKFDENNKLTTDLLSIGKGKTAIDKMYSNYLSLQTDQKQELAKALADGGIGNRNIIDDEFGFMQRLRGVMNVALARPAFGGIKGEKLKAFMNSLEANIPLIARSLGHTGVLTELDVLKSFGIAPDPKGTLIENVERQRLYNDLIEANKDVLLGRFSPVYGENIDMDTLNKRLGFKTPTKDTQAPPPVSAKIRVRNKQTGQTGSISPQFFDANKYERIQ